MATFAVKTGVGWGYLWLRCPRRKRVLASALLLLVYAALFTLAFWLVRRANLIERYDIFLPLWQRGFMIHWIVAALLFAWGMILLRRSAPHCEGHSRGWLALVVPCPVCMGVIFISVSLMFLYFPEQSSSALLSLFAAFVVLAAASGILMIRSAGSGGDRSESSLGIFMMLISSYFIVSALVMPNFADIGRIYRLSVYAGEVRNADINGLLATFGLIFLVAFAGFVGTAIRFKNKNEKSEVFE